MTTKTAPAIATTGEYVIGEERGHGMALDNLKMRPTIRAVVKFSTDGKIAWSGPTYWEGHQSRNWKAQAGAMRRRYQAHFDRTGSRFEVEQENAKLERKRLRDAAIAKRKEVREAAPQLLEILRQLTEMAGGMKEGPVQAKLFEARALIAPLDFPEIPEI